MSEIISNYERLAKINVNDKIEKKNNLSYLSWAWAVDQLLRVDPLASWEYREPVRWNDSVMVFCTVTAFGKAMTAQLPVMDHRNKAISNPDAFQVNTAMQRCLAKAIALHGLGLYIYAGEDLPEGEETPKKPVPESSKSTPTSAWDQMDAAQQAALEDISQNVIWILTEDAEAGPFAAIAYIKQSNLSADENVALWSRFDSKQRSAMKKAAEANKLDRAMQP